MLGVFAKFDNVSYRSSEECFVLMPFREDFRPIFRIIQRCCKDQGIQCRRADTDPQTGRITESIYRDIFNAAFIVADVTGGNKNVLYEVGLAHAITDRVILLTQSLDDVPFDLRDFRHILYDNSIEGGEDLFTQLFKQVNLIKTAGMSVATVAEVGEVSSGTVANQESDFVDPLDIDDPSLLHSLADLAGAAGQVQKAKGYLEQALNAATKSGDGMPPADASAIGNCAIEAESQGFSELAEKLYQAAIELDPDHINNLQSYVSFILDTRSNNPSLLVEADRILGRLDAEPTQTERTVALRAQYLAIKDPASGSAIDHLRPVLDELSERQSLSMANIAQFLIAVKACGATDFFIEAVERLRPLVPDSETWVLDRAMADELAKSSQFDHEETAIEMYREFLEADVDPSVLSNLAVLYCGPSRIEHREIAVSLFLRAYAMSPGESLIRKAFVRLLSALGCKAEAEAVIAGRPLSEVVVRGNSIGPWDGW